MPRVTFLNIPAHGHVSPTLGIVEALARRGIEVTYHCGRPHRRAIEAAGAAFVPYPPGWIDDDMPHDGDLVQLADVILRAEARITPALRPVVAAERPDVIVHDSLAPWGKTIAASLGVPGVCSTTTFVFDHRVALHRPELLARLVARHLHGAAKLLELPTALEATTSRERTNLVYTSRAFQPLGDTFDDRFVFVGPVTRDEPPLDEALAVLERPIYVSLGTLFNDRPWLFRAAAEGLAGLGHPVVISTGGRLDPAELGPLPAGVLARRWVPQLRLLARAALVVTHGGMNTANEALLHDVPLVVLPQAADQSWVARRVADLGAGVVVRRPTAQTLREAAVRVLGDAAFAAAAAGIGATLREAGGAERAADAILAAVTSASGAAPRAGG